MVSQTDEEHRPMVCSLDRSQWMGAVVVDRMHSNGPMARFGSVCMGGGMVVGCQTPYVS